MSDQIIEQQELDQQANKTAETEQSAVEQTEEQAGTAKEEDMAAVMAGYNKPSTQEQQEQQDEDPAKAIPRMIAGIPEDDIAAKLKKVDELETSFNERMQKVNNMLGNMKQRLEAIPKDAPKAEMRAITADSMKKLREMGFDELAEALAEDLNGTLSVPSAQVDVKDVISKAMRTTAERELDDLHPDWHELVAVDKDGKYVHPGFSVWINSLTPEMQKKVRTSESVAFASRTLDSFKAWEKDKENEKAGRATQARNTSESRLQNAMTPTQGKAAAQPSRLPDESGLWAGYNKGHKPFRR